MFWIVHSGLDYSTEFFEYSSAIPTSYWIKAIPQTNTPLFNEQHLPTTTNSPIIHPLLRAGHPQLPESKIANKVSAPRICSRISGARPDNHVSLPIRARKPDTRARETDYR